MPAEADPTTDSIPLATHRLWPWAVAASFVLALLAWQGHHLAHLLPLLEQWLVGIGPFAPLVYVLGLALVQLTMIPDSLFGVGAGVVFGAGTGIACYYGASVISSLVIYALSRSLLRRPVLRMIEARPQLRLIQRAATKDATRLCVLVRMLPINLALVSYTLGAAGLPLRPFLIGLVATLPHLALTVLLGAAASHVTRMAGQGHRGWTLESAATVAGFFVTLLVLALLIRHGRRALAALESESEAENPRAADPL